MYDHNDDFQDFLQEMGDVKPIKSDDRVRLDNTQQTLAKQLPAMAMAPNGPNDRMVPTIERTVLRRKQMSVVEFFNEKCVCKINWFN